MVREFKTDVIACNQVRIKRVLPVVSPIIVEQNILKEGIFHKCINQNKRNRYFQHMYGILVIIASAQIYEFCRDMLYCISCLYHLISKTYHFQK